MNKIFVAMMLVLVPMLSFAQSTSTLNLSLDGKMILPIGNNDARIDILAETLKQYPALKTNPHLEISMVRLESKSSVGGAQLFLRVNNTIVDGASVETNSDLTMSTDVAAFQKFDLKNIDRSQITELSLILQSVSNIRIRNIQIVLGTPEEPAIFGHYADKQVGQVGGGQADNQAVPDERVQTTAEQIEGVYQEFYAQNDATIDPSLVTNTPAAVIPQATSYGQSSTDCLVSVGRVIICTGAIVRDAYEGAGIVQQISFNNHGNHQVNVTFNSGKNVFTMLSHLEIISTGAGSSVRSASQCLANPAGQAICVGQTVQARNGAVVTVLDVQSYRSMNTMKVTDRQGQISFVSVNDLYKSTTQTYTPAPTQVAPQQSTYRDPRSCLLNKRTNQAICVGDRVNLPNGASGTVTIVRSKAFGRSNVDVRMDDGRIATFRVDQVYKR